MCYQTLFSLKDAFSGLDLDEDEDLEISQMLVDYKRRGGHIEGVWEKFNKFFLMKPAFCVKKLVFSADWPAPLCANDGVKKSNRFFGFRPTFSVLWR